MTTTYFEPCVITLNKIIDNLIENKEIKEKEPIYDVIDNDGDYQIDLMFNGIEKKNIKINLNKYKLTIETERKQNKETNYITNHTYFGKYKKVFNIPESCNIEEIKASMNNGILKIIIPKQISDSKLKKEIIIE